MPSKWTEQESQDVVFQAREFHGSLLQRYLMEDLDRLLRGNIEVLSSTNSDFPTTCIVRGERNALIRAKVLIESVLKDVLKRAGRENASREG